MSAISPGEQPAAYLDYLSLTPPSSQSFTTQDQQMQEPSLQQQPVPLFRTGFKKYLHNRYLSTSDDADSCGHSDCRRRLSSSASLSPPPIPPTTSSAPSTGSLSAPQTPQQQQLERRRFVFPPVQPPLVLAHSSQLGQCQSQRQQYLCGVCGRCFSRGDMLSRHARLHSGRRPYACPLCCLAFSRSDHLTTHFRTHTGEKPYACGLCSYSACRKDMINRHMRIHSPTASSIEAEGSGVGSSSPVFTPTESSGALA